MPNFFNLPLFAEDADVHVVIETPRGSHVKFAYDPKLKAFVLRKSLLTGLTYPHDWGFMPSTKAEDGDPLDVMVIHDGDDVSGSRRYLPRDRRSSNRAEEQKQIREK